MKLITRIGWILIAVGAFLVISTISPLGLLLMMLGTPMVFVGATVRAVRAHTQAGDAADDAVGRGANKR